MLSPDVVLARELVHDVGGGCDGFRSRARSCALCRASVSEDAVSLTERPRACGLDDERDDRLAIECSELPDVRRASTTDAHT